MSATMIQSTDPLKAHDEMGTFPEWWKPVPGDILAGTVRRYSQIDLEKSGPTWIMTVQDSNDSVRGVLLSATVLRNEIGKLQPGIGERIIIKYLGIPEKKTYHKYVCSCPDRPELALPNWTDLNPEADSYAHLRPAPPAAAPSLQAEAVAVVSDPSAAAVSATSTPYADKLMAPPKSGKAKEPAGLVSVVSEQAGPEDPFLSELA
jgi:hypothetical protein